MFCIRIYNKVIVVLSSLCIGLDPYVTSETCSLILDIFKSRSTVFKMSGEVACSSGCVVGSIIGFKVGNNSEKNLYVFSKFIGDR
jgi:hypothetical protein